MINIVLCIDLYNINIVICGMRSQKRLLLDQLDRKLKLFQPLVQVPVPTEGWIRTIRTTLNMTLSQLADKLDVDYQSIQGFEEREVDGKITIKNLKEVGEALNMKFVYGFVPKDGSLKNLVDAKAEQLAQKIVLKTHRNMLLEDQGTNDEQIQQAISDLADELKRDLNKSLWN